MSDDKDPVCGRQWRRPSSFAALRACTTAVQTAAGILCPFVGILLSPMFVVGAMSLSSVSMIGNSLRLRTQRV